MGTLRKLLCLVGLHKWDCHTTFVPNIHAKIVTDTITRVECRHCKKVKSYEHLIWNGTDMVKAELPIHNNYKFYNKKLLEMASPFFVLSRFGGNPRLVKYSRPVRLWRWLLRKEPEYEFEYPIKKPEGNTIKFRRYGCLSPNTVIGSGLRALPYTEETVEL